MTAPGRAAPEMSSVEFEPQARRSDVAVGDTVLDAARQADIALASVCGGEGTCGRCRIVVRDGDPGAPSEAEQRALTRDQLAAGERLACRIHVRGPLRVEVPRASMVVEQRHQTVGVDRVHSLDPLVRSVPVAVRPPTLEDMRGDLERVAAATEGPGPLRADPAVMRLLTPLLRERGWQVDVLIRGDEVIGAVEPGRPALGFAVDLGTTKIAGYLVDLARGTPMASQGIANPQARYGADVISRLAHAARTQGGAAELARVTRLALDELLGRLCAGAGADRTQVADGCIVGNTAMHHLFLGLPTRQLSHAPFVASTSSALDIRARELDIEMAADARIHVLPTIGGFVGADTVAMILATDLDRVDAVKVAVDIGTNTEVVIRRPGDDHLSVTSCASGPAFEGANIRDGVSAGRGAIDRVTFDAQGRPCIHTIDDAPAIGICGSGVVDAVAGLHRNGLIASGGRLRQGAPGVREGEHDLEVVLAHRAGSAGDRDIALTQADIGEIQLAKGAIAAGIGVLLEMTGTDEADVEEVVLAGAFGTYLDIDSARDIGLLPRLPNASYVQVGNAAGVGARVALLSGHERERARAIARTSEYVELTTQPGFRRRFAGAMRFPELRQEGAST